MKVEKLQAQINRAVEALDRLREGQELVLIALEELDKPEAISSRIKLLLNIYQGWYEEPLIECQLALRAIDEAVKDNSDTSQLTERESLNTSGNSNVKGENRT